MMRKMIHTACSVCGVEEHDKLMDPEKMPPCHVCGGVRYEIHWTEAKAHGVEISPASVVGDDIPGGLLIHHGICAENGDPIRYYSKTDIRKAAKAKGLVWGMDHSEHVPNPKSGSDKSPHTQRCVAMPGAVTAEQEAERVRAWHEHERQLQEELSGR